MKHMLAYVTPDQTAKTIPKFLYRGYISSFGAPARLFSDRITSFMSSVIEVMQINASNISYSPLYSLHI